MIPILYSNTEKSFLSAGICRLVDVYGITVTEERNGIFECDFSYPVNGRYYDEIQLGRIIYATHDNTKQAQPFDIVQISRPIQGEVKVHAEHVSYRQRHLVTYGTNVATTAAAKTMLQSTKGVTNPFDYKLFNKSGRLPCADGVPHTVREILGGIEGSILDTYGGEYTWDHFTVRLQDNRGTYRNFAIRYGVNLSEYTAELDVRECYNKVLPFYKGQTDAGADVFVYGEVQTYGTTATGRNEIMPLDVSDQFQSKPTVAQVNSAGLSKIKQLRPANPVQRVTVNFVNLADAGYEEYSNLLTYGLCDLVRVIVPQYGVDEWYKIVKTVYNPLLERYEQMELGMPQVSLAKALGIVKE